MKPADDIRRIDSSDRTLAAGRIECDLNGERSLLSLAAVTMKATVAGRVSLLRVEQRFQNPHTVPVEAVYIFPLPGGCAVSDFELKVGTRVVKGEVRERMEARRGYAQAKAEGKRAALMEQERDDVFTVTVGNLPPGEEIAVRIECSDQLAYFDDGMTELRLPVVVAPRYIRGTLLDGEPVGHGVAGDTDGVPDASRITPPRLAEGFDPKVALKIEVELLADGEEIRDLECTQHAVRTGLSADRVTVRLSAEAEPLDRDFVLRWRVASAAVRSSCLAFTDHRGVRYAALSVVPPRRDGFLGRPRDVVFVLDRSGSMSGEKMSSAARACSLLLQTLGPRDRFGIVAFDDRTEWMGAAPHALGSPTDAVLRRAEPREVARGEAFLRGIGSRGGTELLPALDDTAAVFDSRRESSGRAPVIVVLTDGEVGDESAILARVQSRLIDVRVFTIGIDTAVNSGLLQRLASTGGGTSAFVTPGAGLEDALRAVGREIGEPLVTDLNVSGPQVERGSQAPERAPDLFAGRASTVFFRTGATKTVTVRGRTADGKSFEQTVPVREVAHPAIAHLWARARVVDLEDRFRMNLGGTSDLKSEIVRLACEHTLLTRFTAFLAVDHAEIVNAGGQARTVVQPVEMPAKWDQERCVADISCNEIGFDDSDLTVQNEGASPDCSMAASEPPLFEEPAERAPRPAPPSPARPSRKVPARAAGKAPHGTADLLACAEAFDKALRLLFAATGSGLPAAVAAFEAARIALLKSLGASGIASSVPRLQRFLRTDAAAVSASAAALTGGGGVAGLVFGVCMAVWETARKEMADALAAVGVPRGSWAFWERSV